MADSAQYNFSKLSKDHNRDGFACGEKWLDDYLKTHAIRNQETGYGRTYVAHHPECSIVRGFYTISMSSVMFDNLPHDLVFPKMPRYPMPVVHMGCLAVHRDLQKQGLGESLLLNSFDRILNATDIVAARALEVKAMSTKAKQFYQRMGFLPFKDHAHHLYMTIETIRQAMN